MQRWLEGGSHSPRGPPLPALGMSNSYHGEPYIPADVFNVSYKRRNNLSFPVCTVCSVQRLILMVVIQ